VNVDANATDGDHIELTHFNSVQILCYYKLTLHLTKCKMLEPAIGVVLSVNLSNSA
ncbi:MAG: hypothetical protein RLZZ56_208, partial [Actinomycetota bacterium]